ncbi:MAG: ATP-binding cassette domain-containing protein, partial [Burkholderiaceae bacterium]
SVAANIDFALKQVQISDRSQRDAILSSAGLLAKAAQPARLLSGGEQQRLALARALATNPRVLFLDEPTASLDPVSVHLIEQRVRQANQDGTKIIFVTHDIGQVRRLAGDVVFINQGRVLEHTPAATFFGQPASPAARAYLDGRLLLPETQVAIKTNHDKN